MVSIYTHKNQFNSANKKPYESESGPYEDEIYINNLLEQNKNAPIFNGAFMKCHNNGMTTKTDAKKLKSLYYYTVFFSVANLANGFLTIKLLQLLDPLNPLSNNMKSGIPIAFLVMGIGFGVYKVQSLKKKLDKKYTPLWLKSSGSSAISKD